MLNILFLLQEEEKEEQSVISLAQMLPCLQLNIRVRMLFSLQQNYDTHNPTGEVGQRQAHSVKEATLCFPVSHLGSSFALWGAGV